MNEKEKIIKTVILLLSDLSYTAEQQLELNGKKMNKEEWFGYFVMALGKIAEESKKEV